MKRGNTWQDLILKVTVGGKTRNLDRTIEVGEFRLQLHEAINAVAESVKNIGQVAKYVHDLFVSAKHNKKILEILSNEGPSHFYDLSEMSEDYFRLGLGKNPTIMDYVANLDMMIYVRKSILMALDEILGNDTDEERLKEAYSELHYFVDFLSRLIMQLYHITMRLEERAGTTMELHSTMAVSDHAIRVFLSKFPTTRGRGWELDIDIDAHHQLTTGKNREALEILRSHMKETYATLSSELAIELGSDS